MKLKLDENLGKTAAAIFQAGGYDARTVPGQGLSRATDREVIAACQSGRRCLVTLDLDFSNPLLFDPTKYSGESYLTAETLHELERIKLHRKAFAQERCIGVATFS